MKKIGLVVFALIGTFQFNAQDFNSKWFDGMSMRSLGPAGMSGRVTSIDALVSNPDIIYIGTASGGVWKSESGGVHWKPIFDEQPVQSIGAVAITQQNPSIIWAGTGEGNPRNSHNSGAGIFKSIDGGKTWEMVGLKKTKTIHRIIVHPTNENIVYVGATGSAWGENENRGVYKTTDGGKTWNKILYNNNLTGCADLVIDPSNPNKLIAAMWEHKREPWFFKSGGEGSGLYITYDAGENWKQISSKEGIPEGELGRIGLAISTSSPNVIYALIEAKKTGLYRSDDGGEKWRKVADKNIGNRPFYYADIYVDPQNENRIYNLYSLVSKSEDGGKTFQVILPYNRIHPDHHAMWINPNNPNFIIEGNDGGLNITRDKGIHWRFVENLPLAQFYHINIDDEVPYHIYGGMQDNGSWRGPSEVWRRGGIRNHDWHEVMFGDGFDVLPKKNDTRYGYAMYQGGNVATYDIITGNSQPIQPVHPEGKSLRFNWNAAIAQNPFHDNGIYFGSQYVHKSMDAGQSWEIISPDLTTNDSTKQKQVLSGGLTIDATKAENYTSILCIAPSTVKEGVIWVGTDDGNLQVTQDGGTTWQNVYPKMKTAPKGAWIPQIQTGYKNAGEAFVVVNNYRKNDWSPYLYHTKDYGKTWEIMVTSGDVTGYVRSVIQDPTEPNLLFLGTDHGLYFSYDFGSNWHKWMNNFPSTPVSDLKIQEREADLVIGTFGRATYVLDNITPLRELARNNYTTESFKLFEPKEAILTTKKPAIGTRFSGDAHFKGQNEHSGAMIGIWVKPDLIAKEKKEKEAVKEEEPRKKKENKNKIEFTVFSGKDTIRTFTTKPDSGLTNVYWNLTYSGIRFPTHEKIKEDADEPSGIRVLPGVYKVVAQYKDLKDSAMVTVTPDPRLEFNKQFEAKKVEEIRKFYEEVENAFDAFEQLKDMENTVNLVNQNLARIEDKEKTKAVKKKGREMVKKIKELKNLFMTAKDFEGYDHVTERLNGHLYKAYSNITSSSNSINTTTLYAIKKAKTENKIVLDKVAEFYQNDWIKYQEMVEELEYSIFKQYNG